MQIPYGLLFPGQGSQVVGMGRDLYQTSLAAQNVLAEADDALDFSLSEIMTNGPDEKLTLTEYAQPAILTMSVAVLEALREQGASVKPAFTAGHSLGEYTALVAAGVLSLSDAVRLVHKRGAFMQEAVPRGTGAMAALLGLNAGIVNDICREASQGLVCELANDNSPVQSVIAGHVEAVERACELARKHGVKKTVMLKVSAPFHCALMKPVAERLATEMERCTWHDASFPIVANISARAETSAEAIRTNLLAQTYSHVRWQECIRTMADSGVSAYVELGAGKTLTGLVKRIHKGAQTLNAEHATDLDAVVQFMNEERT